MIAALFILAAHLGRMGETFPIEEKEGMEWSAKEIPDGSAGWLSEFIRPRPVPGIEKATERHSFLHDPTCALDEHTSFNPLDHARLPSEMIFFDGDDEEQVAWARKQEKKVLWMLVKGSPLQLQEREHREVFFDQWGYWTEKFGIKHVPAHVKQEGKKIRIDEIPVQR